MHILVSALSVIAPSDIKRRVKDLVARKIFKEFTLIKSGIGATSFGSTLFFVSRPAVHTKEMIE